MLSGVEACRCNESWGSRMLSYLVVGKEQKKASDWVRLLNSGKTGWQTLQVSM